MNLRSRCKASLQRKLNRLKVGDWVRVGYWHGDAQIIANGPVTSVDADGIWVDVLRIWRNVNVTELVIDGDMPILAGSVISPEEVNIGDHIGVIETYAQLTAQVRGYVTRVEDLGAWIWVGDHRINTSQHNDSGIARGVTIKRLSVSDSDIYEIRLKQIPEREATTLLWVAEIWYLSAAVGPQMIVERAAESRDRARVEEKARRAALRVHRHNGDGEPVIRVVLDGSAEESACRYCGWVHNDVAWCETGRQDQRPDLRPLLSRVRYTDEEWEYALAGRCSYTTADYPSVQWCGRPSSPTSYYRACARHDRVIREDNPATYGS